MTLRKKIHLMNLKQEATVGPCLALTLHIAEFHRPQRDGICTCCWWRRNFTGSVTYFHLESHLSNVYISYLLDTIAPKKWQASLFTFHILLEILSAWFVNHEPLDIFQFFPERYSFPPLFSDLIIIVQSVEIDGVRVAITVRRRGIAIFTLPET